MALFVPPKDAHEALWTGECAGVEGAISVFGADEVWQTLKCCLWQVG